MHLLDFAKIQQDAADSQDHARFCRRQVIKKSHQCLRQTQITDHLCCVAWVAAELQKQVGNLAYLPDVPVILCLSCWDAALVDVDCDAADIIGTQNLASFLVTFVAAPDMQVR